MPGPGVVTKGRPGPPAHGRLADCLDADDQSPAGRKGWGAQAYRPTGGARRAQSDPPPERLVSAGLREPGT